LFTPDKD